MRSLILMCFILNCNAYANICNDECKAVIEHAKKARYHIGEACKIYYEKLGGKIPESWLIHDDTLQGLEAICMLRGRK